MAAPKSVAVSAIVTHFARMASVRRPRYHSSTLPELARPARSSARLRCNDAKQGREDHGHEPGDEKRDADDGEEGEGVLARRACREADRDEAGHGHESAGQHGEGVGPVGECRSLDLVVALCQAIEHGIGRGHRIVDEQSERNDEGTKGDALHVDAGQLHDREDDGERQRNGERNHQARPYAESDKAHGQDDPDRLPQRRHELGDGVLDRHGLIGHKFRFDADRQSRR